MRDWKEKLKRWIETLSARASNPALFLAAAVILSASHLLESRLRARAASLGPVLRTVAESREGLREMEEEYRPLTELRVHDVNQLKGGILKLTQSRKQVFEAGLSLEEEKRVLEKQWEIMSTYLQLDEDARKIHLMRGDQSLESYSVSVSTPRAFGGVAEPIPNIVQITSKERFAYPERGSYQEAGGQLVWTPPQVGTSVRANALGEFVTFTNGPLILHGPPRKPEEHAAFPHYCLELSLATARKLFLNTFIGTRVVLKPQKPARQD